MNAGGHDAGTNPPWEAVKPRDKESLADYSSAVTKNTMSRRELDVELRRADFGALEDKYG